MKQIIKISKDQYINDIEPFKTHGIPNNSIIHKEITGCGITTYAIRYFSTHLIAILPSQAAIEAKMLDHNKEYPNDKIIGVYKGIDVDDIKAYLLTDVKFKKIITTPEGFITKVVKAFADLTEMYDNFFLLFDECERIITDVSYRGNIAAPIDEFFNFKHKAMVSATVLPFSDERFKDFNHYHIEPDYDYRKPLTVITTNSVLTSTAEYIQELDSEHICIFFNSTLGINALAKNLDIEKQSKAFCAQDSVVKLLEKRYMNASSYFDVNDMVKYNFFTSRYFSAIDMITSYKPDVIMITDVIFADHSVLDPHTEVIQIAGRFRNGVNSLAHITNLNPEISSMSEADALAYLNGSFGTYHEFVSSYSKATNQGSRDAFKRAIETSTAHSFFLNDKVNTFMVDNFINEERVKGYYKNIESLTAAYNEVANHFELTFQEDICVVSDENLLKLQGRITKREQYKIVADLFESWRSRDGKYIFPPEELRSKLIAKYPDIWDAHLRLTTEEIANTEYSLATIKGATKKAKKLDTLKFLSKKVYKIFNSYSDYPEHEIKTKLKAIYIDEGITYNVGARTILTFFEGSRSSSKDEKIYRLKEKKFVTYLEEPIQENVENRLL